MTERRIAEGGRRMFSAAALLQGFFAKPKKEPVKPAPQKKKLNSTTMTMRALSDLGESIASSTHVIYGQVRLYLCVTMDPKPEALQAQMAKDKRAAKGMFEVDEMWSAAEVNKRWAKDAVLTDGEGHVIDSALIGARGMTDAGANEVFFEFNALDIYPEKMYLANGETRIRVR